MSWSSEFEAPPPRPPATRAPGLDPSAFDDFWSEADRPDQYAPGAGQSEDPSIEEPITVDELVAGLSNDGEEADADSPTPPAPPDPKPPSMPPPSDHDDGTDGALSDRVDGQAEQTTEETTEKTAVPPAERSEDEDASDIATSEAASLDADTSGTATADPVTSDPVSDMADLETELGAEQTEPVADPGKLEELGSDPVDDEGVPTSFFVPPSETPPTEAAVAPPQEHQPLFEADPSFPTDVGIAAAPAEDPYLTAAPRRSRQPGGERKGRALPLLAAVFVGGMIGLIGAVAASQIIGGNAESGDANDGAADSAGEASAVTADDQSSNLAVPSSASETLSQENTDRSAPLGPAISAASPFELNGLQFLPGTVELDNRSQEMLEQLTRSDGIRSGTVALTVRTTSESGDAANLELSVRQAEALRSRLIDLGFSADQVAVTAVGRTLVTHREWVPNFVLVSTGLERSALRTVAEGLPPFSLGIDPRTNELRAESLAPLAALGAAMQNDPDQGSITLAAYAFRGEDAAGNDQLAAMAAAVIENELSNRYDIASDRVDIIVVADAPFAVPPSAGGMVSFYWAP